MKKNIKIIVSIIMVCIILTVIIDNTKKSYAFSVNNSVKEKKECLEYAVADENKDVALKKVKYECKDYLKKLSQRYGLEEINKNNWKEYQNYNYVYLEEDSSNRCYNDFYKLQKFFDIYENKVETSENNSEYNRLLEKSRDISYESFDTNIKSTGGTVNFDVNKANEYARKYATNPNKKEYKTCSADCTNFASQIVNKGGVLTTNEWKPYKKSSISGAYTKYTLQWCNADYFVKYFKAYNTYDSLEELTQYAQSGDIIAYDLTNDNDWDHVGYVVGKRNYSEKLGYADLEIAQHSKNYCSWISDEKNGWDVLEKSSKGVVFAIVRFQ